MQLGEGVNYVTVSSYSVSMLSGVKTSIMSSEHSICAFCKASYQSDFKAARIVAWERERLARMRHRSRQDACAPREEFLQN
jgi:hypothetical protein